MTRPSFTDTLMAYMKAAHRAEYLLEVADAQSIGSTSEAWRDGCDQLREALERASQCAREMNQAGSDPHVAENDPEATVADVLYAALARLLLEIQDGYWPGIGAHGQALRATRRYHEENGSSRSDGGSVER